MMDLLYGVPRKKHVQLSKPCVLSRMKIVLHKLVIMFRIDTFIIVDISDQAKD